MKLALEARIKDGSPQDDQLRFSTGEILPTLPVGKWCNRLAWPRPKVLALSRYIRSGAVRGPLINQFANGISGILLETPWCYHVTIQNII